MTSIKRNKSASKCNLKCFYHLALLVSIFLTEVSGQFFTKSSSKSIPRMGRRSVQQTDVGIPSNGIESAHGLLIDALIDEYGPSLISKLEEAKQEANLRRNNLLAENTETKLDGQPISLMARNYLTNEQPITSDNTIDNPFGRNERSSTNSDKSNSNYRDASLAMRALNADRYIQHLASGQPLTSFESLLANSRERLRNQDPVRGSNGIKQAQGYSFD